MSGQARGGHFDEKEQIERVREALDESLTPSLPLAAWSCDPLPSCPHYAHVNPEWLRSLIAEALRVREALSRPANQGVPTGFVDGDTRLDEIESELRTRPGVTDRCDHEWAAVPRRLSEDVIREVCTKCREERVTGPVSAEQVAQAPAGMGEEPE